MQSSPPDTQSRVDSATTSPPSPLEVTQPHPKPFPALPEDPDLDSMPYPYPRYTDGPDAESRIRAFVSPAALPCKNRVIKNRGIYPISRWTGGVLVFSSPRRGGYYIPGCSNEVPRALPSRSAKTRTVLTVLFHELRTWRESRSVHDPVSGPLPTIGR